MSHLRAAAEVLAKAQYGEGLEVAPDRQGLIDAQLPAAQALEAAGLLRNRAQEVLDQAQMQLKLIDVTLAKHRLVGRYVLPRLRRAGVAR